MTTIEDPFKAHASAIDELYALGGISKQLRDEAVGRDVIRAAVANCVDTTEGVGPLPVGYVEPAEDILSDEEREPIEVTPIEKRVRTPRIYKDRGTGRWYCADDVSNPRFHLQLSNEWISLKSHNTFREALQTLRAESIRDLGFVADAKVQVIGNAFATMNGERGVDYRGETGRVVSVDPTSKLPVMVELDHWGFAQMFAISELEVIPA